MKKFERLPPQQRKEEIKSAALQIFTEKGFSSTTMENIVEKVSLSKGGVYRIYHSTTDILSDIMIDGMHLRNKYYEERVKRETSDGKELTLLFLVEMIGDSLMLYPEISRVYAEFLWEKQRNSKLELLYQEICSSTVNETISLIKAYGAEDLLLSDKKTLEYLTELMNTAILGLHVLGMKDIFADKKDQICNAITLILTK